MNTRHLIFYTLLASAAITMTYADEAPSVTEDAAITLTEVENALPLTAESSITMSEADSSSVTESVAEKTASVLPVYNHRINFDLTRIGYEHIKPKSIYIGIEGWALFSISFSEPMRFSLVQSEVRLGYNFCFNTVDHFTPFVSGGYFRGFHDHQKQGLAYGGLGIRYEHEFNKLIAFGVNAEGLVGGSVEKVGQPWGNPIWGFDIALPLTFRFTEKRNWDFRFEPFVTYFDGTNSAHTFIGARSAIGYRF